MSYDDQRVSGHVSGDIGGGNKMNGGTRTHDEVGVETLRAVLGDVEAPPQFDENYDLLQARGSMSG